MSRLSWRLALWTKLVDSIRPSLHPDIYGLNLQTKTVVDTKTATITEDHTQLQTYTQLATKTQTETQTQTSVVAETALAQCLGKCQSKWGLSAGNDKKYNTYASPSPSYTVTSTAASPSMTKDSKGSSDKSSAAKDSSTSSASVVSSASAVSSAPAAEASATTCTGCSD